MSFKDGANFKAKPSTSKQAAENVHDGASYPFTDAGCGNSSLRDSPWDPRSLLQSQGSPESTREFPQIDDIVDAIHTFGRNFPESSVSKRNPTSDADNPINFVNLDMQSDRCKRPLLDPTAVFDQQTASGCLGPINLGTRKCFMVQREEYHARDESGNSDLLPADCNDNEISITLSIRYPFEIFSEGNTLNSDSEAVCSLILTENERSDTSKESSVLTDISNSKQQYLELSLPFHVNSPSNKNNTIPVLLEEKKNPEILNNMNYSNTDRRQSKQAGLPMFQKLDLYHTNTRIVCTRCDLPFNNPSFQNENNLQNVRHKNFSLPSVINTVSLSNSVENPRFTSDNHQLMNSNSQTNTLKNSSGNPGSKVVSDTVQCSSPALPTCPPVNYDCDRSQPHPTKPGNLLSSTNNNLRPQSHSQQHDITNKLNSKPASPQRNTERTFHTQEHAWLSTCDQSVSSKQSKICSVSERSAAHPVSSDKCYQDTRCTSSRPHHSDTGTVVVVADSAVKHALNRNTSSASSLSTLQGMAGQNHHHLSRTVLDESAPRVPVHPPPLDNSDVMGVPERDVDVLLFQDEQRTSSLSTSFADLMLGDHTALRHKGRDGRLGRCGEGRDSTRLYGLSEAATIASLRETVLALQLQNTQLSLCLQQERSRREQAESLVDQEKGYIKRLEDTIQTLKSTRLVIDPNMYRQIAESYIAARKAPVRRTCSSSQQRPGHYEDLVCDSSPDNSLSPSPTSPNSTSSSQFIINDATKTGSNPTFTSPSASSTYTNDSFATLSPLSSTKTTTLPSQTPIFNERQDLRWPSERREINFSSDDYLSRNNRSPTSHQESNAKRRDV